MKTIELTKDDFLKKVADYESNPDSWNYLGDKPAIVDFYAHWCGPCRMISPILEEFAAEYADDLYIYKVNTDDEEELSEAFNIQTIPTLLFLPMGKNPQISIGGMSKPELKRVIQSVLINK